MILSEQDIEHFWNKVEVGRLEDCWPFLGYCRPKKEGGHGHVRVKRKTYNAHRVALASTGVQIDGKVVRHRCIASPSCCNPSHLHTGDAWANIQDRIDQDRSAKGEHNGRAKLTEKRVIEMRQSDKSHWYFGKKYHLDNTTISLARRGVTWRHLNEKHPPIKIRKG